MLIRGNGGGGGGGEGGLNFVGCGSVVVHWYIYIHVPDPGHGFDTGQKFPLESFSHCNFFRKHLTIYTCHEYLLSSTQITVGIVKLRGKCVIGLTALHSNMP